MTAKFGPIGVALAVLIAAPGCVSYGHKAAKVALAAGPACGVPLQDRRHVYAFMVNGLTPGVAPGLDGLRDRLAECGFMKVYVGGLCHELWFEDEMKRVIGCDPDARFVFVGYDYGCGSAAALGAAAARAGWPVEAVVLLDPAGPAAAGCPTRTVLVTSGAYAEVSPHTERVAIPEANHFALPTHPRTVETLCEIMRGAASQVVRHPEYDVPESAIPFGSPSRYVPAPHPVTDPAWLFLDPPPELRAVPLSPVPIAPALVPRGGYVPADRLPGLPPARPVPYYGPPAW